VTALGGAQNLTEVDACTTRLRLVLVDNKAVDEATLKRLGARGILRSSAQGLQVVLGPIADQVAGEIRAALRSAPPSAPTPPPPAAGRDAPALLAALGGRGNVVDLATAAGRLLIRTARPESIDESALARLGIRGLARSAADRVQVLVAGPVEEWGEPLRRLL
jgi:PTS system N-acetylglucosamine-specific IIC component